MWKPVPVPGPPEFEAVEMPTTAGDLAEKREALIFSDLFLPLQKHQVSVSFSFAPMTSRPQIHHHLYVPSLSKSLFITGVVDEEERRERTRNGREKSNEVVVKLRFRREGVCARVFVCVFAVRERERGRGG